MVGRGEDRIRIRMDPPILVSLDPDPDPHFLRIRIRIHGTFFEGKYGDFHIINQISQKPCLTFFLG